MKILSIALSFLCAFSGLSVVAMQGPTHYDILGVSSVATNAEIKAAYKGLSMRYHPDRNVDKADIEKIEAERQFKLVNSAHETLKDFQARQKYDQFINGNQQPAGDAQFAGRNTDAQDHLMLLAGIFAAKKTYSYVTHAWNQYTIHNNFLAIKEHAELQIRNKQENKPIIPIREALDISWLMQLRQKEQPSLLEHAINHFDRLAIQNPQSLPTICPQLIKEVDRYCNLIGNGSTSLFKAMAVVGAGTIGYLTSDQWLPKLLSSRLFYIGLRLFS